MPANKPMHVKLTITKPSDQRLIRAAAKAELRPVTKYCLNAALEHARTVTGK